MESLIGDDTFSTAATRAGFDKSAFTRWKRGAAADPAFAVKLARAYGANVLEALVQAELITSEEAELRTVDTGQRMTDRELIRKLALRIDANPEAWFGTFGELTDEGQGASIHQLHPTDTPDVHGLQYVADSSPDEPEEGDDDYHDGP